MTDDYLERAIERVITIWKQIGADWTPRLDIVRADTAPSDEPPFVWLYPGPLTPVPLASELGRRDHALTMRLVLAATTEGSDDEAPFRSNEARLTRIIPQVLNAFEARRSLVTAEGEAVPRYLIAGGVRIQQVTPRGDFVGASFIEAWFQLTLPFLISIEPLYGN